MVKKKKEKKGKEYHEIFEVEKGGKKKILDVKGFEEEEKPSKKQIKEENKLLRNIFITIGALILLILLVYFIIDNARTFEYENIEFEIVKFCDVKPCLILYQTKFPVLSGGKVAEYNFYLRNDPRKLNVAFIGNFTLREGLRSEGLVINIPDELSCDGDATIALGNIVNFYGILDVEFVRNEALGCNQNGKSIFLDIQKGNETSIEQTGPLCYKISINNCEVLKGTERFLLESFVELNRIIKEGV